MSNPITDIQSGTAALLSADPYFANIPVFTEDVDNYREKIAEAVAKAKGIATMVTTPNATVGKGNRDMPLFFDPLVMNISTYEKVALNRPAPPATIGTGKSALDVTLTAMALVHLQFPVMGYWQNIVAAGYKRIPQPAGFLCYSATIQMIVGLNYPIPGVANPTISGSGSYILSCGTPNAQIFYTLDGSAPAPRKGSLYTAPFAASSPTKIQCRAWLSGYTPSAIIGLQL